MEQVNPKIYNLVLQFSTIGLTLVLVWFAFVYYPQVVSQFQRGAIKSRINLPPAAASLGSFLIEEDDFRVAWEVNSDTYYAFIEGGTIGEFLANKNQAQLALKNALLKESLCDLNILFISTANLAIGGSLKLANNC